MAAVAKPAAINDVNATGDILANTFPLTDREDAEIEKSHSKDLLMQLLLKYDVRPRAQKSALTRSLTTSKNHFNTPPSCENCSVFTRNPGADCSLKRRLILLEVVTFDPDNKSCEISMSSQTPFSLRIFIVDGDPDGLRLVERSNWIGKAVMFPRSLYPQVRKRTEFEQTGVYLLLGPRTEGDGDTLYIGEADPVRPRLDYHYANSDFWTRAVFFVATSGQLNKAHVQYLESQLVSLAKAAKRIPLENVNTPSDPSLSEADRADMDVFLENILGMLPVLGIHAFERSPSILPNNETPVLACHGRGVTANGRDTTQGFVVQAESHVAIDETPSLKEHYPNVCKLRDDLLKSGILVSDGDTLRFIQDYTFSSPSLASSVVLGAASNGRIIWKDKSGKTLKQLQERQAEN